MVARATSRYVGQIVIQPGEENFGAAPSTAIVVLPTEHKCARPVERSGNSSYVRRRKEVQPWMLNPTLHPIIMPATRRPCQAVDPYRALSRHAGWRTHQTADAG